MQQLVELGLEYTGIWGQVPAWSQLDRQATAKGWSCLCAQAHNLGRCRLPALQALSLCSYYDNLCSNSSVPALVHDPSLVPLFRYGSFEGLPGCAPPPRVLRPAVHQSA